MSKVQELNSGTMSKVSRSSISAQCLKCPGAQSGTMSKGPGAQSGKK
ncbi:hypothetical protein HYE35_03910 [Mycoplasmopsis bovis]|nr:hypothetical protein [Mycoplasmopsis bovis]QQH21756.1 hypothetical protein HYE35_03910 [Mycoplasmopsis bovis]